MSQGRNVYIPVLLGCYWGFDMRYFLAVVVVLAVIPLVSAQNTYEAAAQQFIHSRFVFSISGNVVEDTKTTVLRSYPEGSQWNVLLKVESPRSKKSASFLFVYNRATGALKDIKVPQNRVDTVHMELPTVSKSFF